MRRMLLIVCATALLPVAAAAQPHTLVALSHEDHTAYEIDPATGQVVHTFTAQNQPHEGVASPDGRTALMIAAMFNRSEIVEFLIAQGADPHACDAGGATALAAAAMMGATDTQALLARLTG